MNARTLILSVALLTAVVASFLLKRPADDTGGGDAMDAPDGYYLTGVALKGTDAAGQIRYELLAERVDHNAADGSIALTTLALHYGNGDYPWTITAKKGRMPGSSDALSLSGGVEVEDTALRAGVPTRITSDTLYVDIEKQSANTSDPVMIELDTGSLTGVGMEVDFANKRLSILSDVKGVFVPPPE